MRVAIYTLGCKVNQYETQALERELERFFIAYGKLPAEELTEHRYDRFRKM